MFAKVLDGELQEAGNSKTKIFSIAPGIIDTEMQTEIRAVPDENFSNKSKFVSLKENNELTSPEEVANNLLDVIQNPEKYPNVVMDFREL